MSSSKSMLPTASFSTGNSRSSTGSTLTEASWESERSTLSCLAGTGGRCCATRRWRGSRAELRLRPLAPTPCRIGHDGYGDQRGDDRRARAAVCYARSHRSDRSKVFGIAAKWPSPLPPSTVINHRRSDQVRESNQNHRRPHESHEDQCTNWTNRRTRINDTTPCDLSQFIMDIISLFLADDGS